MEFELLATLWKPVNEDVFSSKLHMPFYANIYNLEHFITYFIKIGTLAITSLI